jgi:glutaredoxin
VALTAVLALSPACKRSAPSGTKDPTVVVRDDVDALLLTWIDEKGEFHVEHKVGDVPPMGKDVVKVVDPNVEETAIGERIVVADLRKPNDDGTYPVSFMARTDFDGLALSRRKRFGKTLAGGAAAVASGAQDPNGTPPPRGADPASGSSAQADARPAVVIYGASWCGACHEAAAYLKRKGIPFVEKDIEEDGAAAREMQSKLQKSGLRGGSIPVIDVRGRVMVGFNPRAIEDALGRTL